MRYQERIYIENDNSSVRNKDILNVNMSSDICIFESPRYNISGATSFDCTGATGTSHVINVETTIPLTFNFTANTTTFTATNATFKYEIYKYNSDAIEFLVPAVYKSKLIDYSGFSATSSTAQFIPISGVSLDGEYIVKGFYEFDACTDFLNKLGKKVDTITYRGGTKYGIYDPTSDYYFIATTSASTPTFINNISNTPPNGLFQQVIIPTNGETILTITNAYVGAFVLTLNGLVLAPNYDYTYTGNVVTLTAETVSDDIITVIYTTGVGNSLIGDNIYVTSPVISGTTNGEGSNLVYFNTTSNKYEVYTTTKPSNGDTIIMLNGATLANGIDFYQSSTNPKRFILEGDIVVSDIITIVYFPITNTIGGIITNTPSVTWEIAIPPQLSNGLFTLEVSTSSVFSTIYYSSTTDYIIGQTIYSGSFIATGDIGRKLYYRVKNEKKYATICGNIINTVAYSEIIPLIVQTNSINTY